MKYGLGIDTGGTYTDAVIYDFDQEKALHAAKSITVKEDLTIGISDCLDRLPAQMLEQTKLVSLSTTLATNACVEGKGCRAVLVLIGCDRDIVKKYGHEYGLPDIKDIIFLNGGHNQQGGPLEEPDWDELRKEIALRAGKVDSFAVVELWGIRNAEFEKKAKELIAEWTGTQTICGHELTSEINSLKRAASALLNAQLIPIIRDFFKAVKVSLARKGIKAPLVMVRGDGSLMSEEFAQEKPIETLLSGPSASVAGGVNLTGEKNGIIVDMGGTTSDIAIVSGGRPRLTPEGANVGKWKTGTGSILINTVGLGGDSLIRHNNENRLNIGPVRAASLSWAASRWPSLLEKIKGIYENKKRHTISLCEFFYSVRDISGDPFYTDGELRIHAALQKGPLSVEELAEAVGKSIYDLQVQRLEQYGAVMRCGLTPTDIMHLTGEFTGWNREAARFGAMIMAHQINNDLDELIKMVYGGVKEKLYYNIVSMLIENEEPDLYRGGITRQLADLIHLSYERKKVALESEQQGAAGIMGKGAGEGPESFFGCAFTASVPLIGIGAPIHIFLPDVARLLGTDGIVPENAGVANAVGAITGNVVVEESVTVKPVYNIAGISGYLCFSPSERREFAAYEDAVEWSRGKVYEMVKNTAQERGAGSFDITVSVNERGAEIASVYKEDRKDQDAGMNKKTVDKAAGRRTKKGNSLFLETIVTGRAVGKVMWI